MQSQKSEIRNLKFNIVNRIVNLAIVLLVTLLPWPHVVDAQTKKIPRVGFLIASAASAQQPRLEAFKRGLRELGYIEGQNIAIEVRSGEGKPEQLPVAAAELVSLKVEVIVSGGPTSTRAAKQATNTIPIVMTLEPNPVSEGLVANLARPGGEHYRVVHSGSGAERKTTGASERNCS